ncbi:hypothetical protein [Oleiharenicola lentus]|uniref:hypothetical protein n=1 Tax=Oleiharenicola lentus TaxID=2508720 RepID=UPI003F66F9D7
MNVSDPLSPDYDKPTYLSHRFCRSVSWPAIFAGISAAIALQLLFTLLGAGLGFALYNPITDENPVADLGKGAVIIHGISAVLSLWFGGWVAGRFTPAGIRASAWLHGFLVWTTATVAGIVVVALGAGWIMGDISKIVGGGLSATGKPLAAMTSGATDMAKDAVKQSGDTVSSFVDEALGTRALTAPRDENIRAKREISFALASLFNPINETSRAEKRTAAIKALDEYTSASEAEATRTVDGWIASYDRVKAELNAAKEQAEAKARVAAEKAADALAIFSFCAFAAFVLGAIAASCGGCHGAKCARRCEERTVVL